LSVKSRSRLRQFSSTRICCDPVTRVKTAVT
jgi:hypothetical protein